jgi:hypothetical protein
MAVEAAKYNVLVHMDDDDFYFPDHVLVKVRLMMKYKAKGVLSLPIGVYDMMERSSFIAEFGKTNNVPEATLAYTRRYWEANKFDSEDPIGKGEGRPFMHDNFTKFVNVNFLFNMISITHTKNLTGDNRRLWTEGETGQRIGDFSDVFPEEFKYHLENVRKILASERV